MGHWAYLVPFPKYTVISVELQFFPIRMYFALPLKGFPSDLGTGTRGQKLEWWGYWAEKEVLRYIQPYGYITNLTDRQTAGRMDTGRQQIPRLTNA